MKMLMTMAGDDHYGQPDDAQITIIHRHPHPHRQPHRIDQLNSRVTSSSSPLLSRGVRVQPIDDLLNKIQYVVHDDLSNSMLMLSTESVDHMNYYLPPPLCH